MPLPFFIPLAALLTKVAVSETVKAVVLTTVVTTATNDIYQELKESARSSDDNKRDRD